MLNHKAKTILCFALIFMGNQKVQATLKEGSRSAPRRENPSMPPLLAQSTRDMSGSRGRLTFSSFFSSSRKADTPLTIVWKGCRKTFINKQLYYPQPKTD